MPSVVHFAPSLVSGGLLVGKTNVNTQVTGLVDVTVDYICRTADLDTHLEKFFLDAPPPVFPSRTISTTALVEGKLFMVNYGVQDQYGVATISARYAGVTSKPIKPYATFEYSDFAVAVPVYVSLSGAFGSQEFIGFGDSNNDFAFPPGAMTVGFRGRAESIAYTWATLDTASVVPTTLPPRPTPTDALAELELVPGAIVSTNYLGQFGEVFNEQQLDLVIDGQNVGSSYTPPKVNSLQVLEFAASANGLTGTQPLQWFGGLTVEQWQARGVLPNVTFQISRRTQAITPSVYIREIEYTPLVRGR
jgi:hypothetical protein